VRDLEEADRTGLGGGAVAPFLGRHQGRTKSYPDASPHAFAPLGVSQLLVQGTADRIVPISQSERYEAAARTGGEMLNCGSIAGADHFNLIGPSILAWADQAAWLTEQLAPAAP